MNFSIRHREASGALMQEEKLGKRPWAAKYQAIVGAKPGHERQE